MWSMQVVACWFWCWKTQFISFDQSNNTVAIDAKMNGSATEVKSSLNMLGLCFSSRLDCYIISIAKTASKIIPYMKCLSPEVALYL